MGDWSEIEARLPGRSRMSISFRAVSIGVRRLRRERGSERREAAPRRAKAVAVPAPATPTGPRILPYSEIEPGMVVNVRPVGKAGEPMFRRITDVRTLEGHDPFFMLAWEQSTEPGEKLEFPGNGWKVRSWPGLAFEVRA